VLFFIYRGKDVEGIIQDYIKLLHEYNEVKDAGQILFGKLAELQGKTTKAIYHEFDVDINE
jgi:hypothetical protein